VNFHQEKDGRSGDDSIQKVAQEELATETLNKILRK